jgi:hypothetical protein
LDYSLVCVAQTPEFVRQAASLLAEAERSDLILYLAAHPESGELIVGTGGLRKLRWRRAGSGKRGGTRVIYYFHDRARPLYLLTMYAKSERADLSADDRRALAALVRRLVGAHERSR